MDKLPRMISLLEAAQMTGLSYEFLRQKCLDGTLVHIRSGRKFMVNAAKLAAYLNGELAKGGETDDR